ncbi:MAG: hypothetical protein KGM47_06490 [Acidobacteriota bacterium]|nr:hypothetical protein [Acidobacteriota bacterium]
MIPVNSDRASTALASLVEIKPESGDVRAKSQRKFIPLNATPPLALKWVTSRERKDVLVSWMIATGKKFAEYPRCLRVAWALQGLVGTNGYAFPTDAYLSKQLGIPAKKIQEALHQLDKGGAIIRCGVFTKTGRDERRIWLSSENIPPEEIPPTMGDMDTPHHRSEIPPTMGGQKYKNRNYTVNSRPSPTQLQARRASEIREQRSLRTRDEGALAEGTAKRRPGEGGSTDSDILRD